ncbi:MAG: GmrSD restriction endonuclease domain-containing protein [Halobacteriota archaeon]
MKATEAKLLDFLKKSPQFVIPIYQRTYSWTEKECRQLWDDVVRCGKNDHIPVHFIGSIVYVESGLSQVTHQAPLLVIDGQQRLTTVSLLLTALAEAVGETEPFEGFSQRKIRNYFLLNPEEIGERHFKLLLSQTDKDTLTALVGEHPKPENHSLRVSENHAAFHKWIKSGEVDLPTLCKGLAKLVVVDIALNRDQDNPQLIFESMNSTGKELSQADLIRNFILMGLEPTLQTRLYEQFWRPMEVDFGQEAYGTHFDSFMRHYLTVMSGEIPNINAVYEAFKAHARETRVKAVSDDSHVEMLVSTIRDYSRYFCAMALGKEIDPELKRSFHDLRELKVDVAYPFLLELYHDYATQYLSKADFASAVRWVEAYVFRRAVCAIPTNSMNKTFATFSKALKKDRYLESIAAHFLLLPSYRRFPSDDEYGRDIQTRDLYNFRSRSYWLRRFENHGRKEVVPVDEYTVEHILPQNENLNAAWQESLGVEWKRIQQTWLHTLGNLTLTGYNSEYSDRSFVVKRDMEGGFKQSPLKVNQGLGQVEIWDEMAIIERAKRLAKLAVQVWDSPKLNDAILEAYRPKAESASSYTIDDHPYLLTPAMRALFEAFRKEVLALDPCVSEEFLKLYVAYKAETNFVDIVPQAKRLRLSLNMSFAEISDPKGLCKDVTMLGRWGNGDVEVGLSSLDELPYVIGLVRQAIEKQLGDADSA